jgi:hypothetical protein
MCCRSVTWQVLKTRGRWQDPSRDTHHAVAHSSSFLEKEKQRIKFFVGYYKNKDMFNKSRYGPWRHTFRSSLLATVPPGRVFASFRVPRVPLVTYRSLRGVGIRSLNQLPRQVLPFMLAAPWVCF